MLMRLLLHQALQQHGWQSRLSSLAALTTGAASRAALYAGSHVVSASSVLLVRAGRTLDGAVSLIDNAATLVSKSPKAVTWGVALGAGIMVGAGKQSSRELHC